MRKLYFAASMLMISLASIAQPGTLIWQKCYGGTGADSARSVSITTDGGFYVAGLTYSNNGNVTGSHNSSGNFSDAWVIKLDKNGGLLWQKTYGGSNSDVANSIFTTSDGGAVFAGYTNSLDGDVSGLHGGAYDFWVVKIDASGTIQWQKTFGGTGNDYGRSVKQTVDGGFVVAGSTFSTDGDVTLNHGGSDFWIVKLDASGALVWQKSLGGSLNEDAYSVAETVDGGFVATGETNSTGGDVSRGSFLSPTTSALYWLTKLNANGELTWQGCFGGSHASQAYAVIQTSDNDFVMSGATNADDYNASGNFGGTSASTSDDWIVKSTTTGGLNWQFCIGGSLNDVGRGIIQMRNGNLAVTGYTNSSNGNVTGAHDLTGATTDLWTYELNSSGYSKWENSFGGTANDGGYDLVETTDSDLVEVGYAVSTDGNVTGNHGASDFWVIKVQSKTGAAGTGVGIEDVAAEAGVLNIYPNPTHDYLNVTVSDALIGNWMVLTDAVGRSISRQQIEANRFTISTAGLARGVYMIKLQDSNIAGLVKKVVVE